MKSTVFLIIVLLVGRVLATSSQTLDKMPKNQRESLLVAVAKEVVMKFGPDYYREYPPPVIERHQVPPKGEINPTGEMAGRIIFWVIFYSISDHFTN